MTEEDEVMTDVPKGEQVPFSVITDLFRDLRSIRHAKRGYGRSVGDKKAGLQKRERLEQCWLSIAEKYSRELLANRKSDDTIVPAHLLPPDEAFKVISLICPTLDSVHSYIGMKENKMSEAFISALDLFPTGDEAIWLRNYRERQYRPENWKLAETVVDGSFPSVLKAVLQVRCPSISTLTINDVWDTLTTLSEVSNVGYHRIQRTNYHELNSRSSISPKSGRNSSKGDKKIRIDALRKVIQAGTPDDVSEFARILLKDTEINVSQDWFFSWFHPGAKQHYNQTHDLTMLIKDCHDPTFRIGEVAVQVGRYASVLLTQRPSRKNLKVICERLRGDGDGKGISGDSAIAQSQALVEDDGIGSKYFIVEPKFDGERMQLHLDRTVDEKGIRTSFTVETFSRRGMNSSEMYADALRDVIDKSVRADAIILDGEIMIWDVFEDAWLNFDKFRNISTKFAQRIRPSGSAYIMKYMVFDVLYVDQSKSGKSTTSDPSKIVRLPLHLRRKLLESVIRPTEAQLIPGLKTSIEIVEARRSRTEPEVLSALQALCAQGYEGVIAKNPDQPYVLGERRPEIGIKLKPDYFDGGLVDIDVLILGGRFSTSVSRKGRQGDVSSFLIGVRDDKYSAEKDGKWIPVGAIGTGYSDEELRRIRDQLDGHWEDFDPKNIPPHFTERTYSNSIFKDCSKWIAPRHSIIITVRAYELSMTFLGLRFPRVERINWTKPCLEAISICELIELNEEKTPPFVRGDDQDPDNARDTVENLKKKQKSVAYSREQALIAKAEADGIRITGGRSSRKIISSARGADVSEVSVICDAFNDLTFLVISTDEEVKHDLEVKVHELGGKFLQNFTKDVSFVIGVDGENVDKLEEKYISNPAGASVRPIIKAGWIRRCHAQKVKEGLQWRDMVFAPPVMEKEMLKDNDRFGDPWVEETTPEGLLQCVEKIRNEKRKNLTFCEDTNALKLIDDAVKNGFAALKGRSFFVPKDLSRAPRAATLLVRALGGNISDDIQAGDQILVHQTCLNEWNKLKTGKGGLFGSCEVVSSEWVENLFKEVQSKHSKL